MPSGGPDIAGSLQQYFEDQMRRQRDDLQTLLRERVTALEDGTGSAYGARVNSENNVGVESRYGRNTPTTTFVTVGVIDVELVPATTRRLQVTIQNVHDANTLYISLGGTPVAGQDLMLLPGGMYSLPPGVAYEGAIRGVASDSSTGVVIVEYKVSD